MAKSFTVLSTQTIKSAKLERAGMDDVLVLYTTDAGHTDSVTIPAESYSDETLTQAVREKEASRGAIVGRTLEL